MTRKRNYLKKAGWLLILYGSLLIFLFSTNPRKLPISLLVLPFMWLFAAFFFTILFSLQVFRWSEPAIYYTKRRYIIAAVAAALPTVALLLDSIDQLTIKDSLLIGTVGLLGLFYATKANFKNTDL